jgi:hypothetical protein
VNLVDCTYTSVYIPEKKNPPVHGPPAPQTQVEGGFVLGEVFSEIFYGSTDFLWLDDHFLRAGLTALGVKFLTDLLQGVTVRANHCAGALGRGLLWLVNFAGFLFRARR